MLGTFNSVPLIVCLCSFRIMALTGVPVMFIIVWACYFKRNFSYYVLFKVLTLPKGRKKKKSLYPLKQTSGCKFLPIKYTCSYKRTHVECLQADAVTELGEI